MTTPDETPIPVEYLTTARLGEKGQLTLPKAYRAACGLDAGTPIAVLQLGSGLLLIPEHGHFHQLCDRIAATFAEHGIQAQELLATLPEARERVVARHYPELAAPAPARQRTKRR